MNLSIIIVNWNTRDLLLQCVRSIIGTAKISNFEIIVVDNNSSDDSCSAIQNAFPQIRLIKNELNLGFAKANNIGIRQSSGKYLALINSDIELLPDCLDSLYGYMESNPNVGIAAPKILNPDGTYQLTCRKFPSLWNDFVEALMIHSLVPGLKHFSGELINLDHQKEPYVTDLVGGCFLFIRRQTLDSIGLLDEQFFFYGEDKDLCWRSWKAGWPIIYVPSATAIHYGGASSSKIPEKFNQELQRAQLQFWKKHCSPFRQYCFLCIRYLNLIRRVGFCSIAYLFQSDNRDRNAYKIKMFLLAIGWLLKNSRRIVTLKKEGE